MDSHGEPGKPLRAPKIAKYDVIEEVGHGGMATVYRAVDRRLEREVALKVIHPHLRDSPEARHRFLGEARAVARLHHPNIVEVFDVSSEGEDETYLVVELLRGDTLRKLLRDRGPMPVEVGAAIVSEILAGLEHAHGEGVIHRDVKPENVLIELRKGSPRDGALSSPEPTMEAIVKLTDFGIAKLLDVKGVTATGDLLGSPAYMAPEQIEGSGIDVRADIFAAGVLFYEAVVGILPFDGTTPVQVLRRVLEGTFRPAEQAVPTVGRGFSAIIDRALAHRPEDRFPSAAAMRDEVLSELRRLGISRPVEEVRSYLTDPAAYLRDHGPRMVAILRTTAAEARRRGLVLLSAADYNRALAYAPDDRELLRAAASVRRSYGRSRALLALAIGTTAILAGTLAFLRKPGRSEAEGQTSSREVPAPSTPIRGQAPEEVDAAAALSNGENPSDGGLEAVTMADGGKAQGMAPEGPPLVEPPPNAPNPPNPTVPPRNGAGGGVRNGNGTARPVERVFSITGTYPPFGVLLSVDDAPPVEVTVPHEVRLDGRPHSLRFTCAKDACEPLVRSISADAKGEDMTASLTIRPAILVIEGDSRFSYQIADEPSILLRSGVPARIPMRQFRLSVDVFELPSKEQRTVTLTAGLETRARFGPASP